VKWGSEVRALLPWGRYEIKECGDIMIQRVHVPPAFSSYFLVSGTFNGPPAPALLKGFQNTYSLRFKIKSYVWGKSMGLRSFFALWAQNRVHCVRSSHLALSGKVGVFIVKSKTFGANFTGSPQFGRMAQKRIKTVLMCVDAIEFKYRLLNEWELLFDSVVHQQQHLH
jgi:hypothetical protein